MRDDRRALLAGRTDDGTRTISVGVSGLAQFWDLFVRAWHGEDMGEMVIFTTEAQARQTMGPDLSTLAASAEDPTSLRNR